MIILTKPIDRTHFINTLKRVSWERNSKSKSLVIDDDKDVRELLERLSKRCWIQAH